MAGMSADPVSKAVQSENHNGRKSIGWSAGEFTNASAKVDKGTLVERKGEAKPDPLGTGSKANRSQGRVGAQYRITASMPAQTEQVAAVQANGRILTPTQSSSGNFYAAEADASGASTSSPAAPTAGTWAPPKAK